MVLSSHGILVEPFLRATDQRKHYVELFRTHGISHHERSHSAFHLHRWERTERSDGLQPLRFFVGNLGIFGVCNASVRDKLTNVCESFDKRGLKTHEQKVQPDIVTCLGNQLDCVGHRSSLTDVGFWPLKRALEYALSLKRLPGRT